MRFLLKIVKWTSVSAIALFVLALGALVSVRSCAQRSNAKAFAIHTPNGVEESGYVRIGGIDQWVQIRGQNRDNPVLLFVHGGPGGTMIPVTRLFLPWEKAFTLVQWDQRGAGKTLKSTGDSIAETMSIDRMAQDGIEVAEYLRTHLHKDKVILLGHSWGSILGLQMAKRRPDLFYAFVGTGQASDMPQSIGMAYAHLLEQSKAAKDQATLQALTRIGPPPFDSLQKTAVFFQSLENYQPASDRVALDEIKRSLTSPPPGYSLRDELDRFRGFTAVPTFRLYQEMLSVQPASLGTRFDLPILFIHGAEDQVTQASLTARYFDAITAPRKEMVLLEGGGHFAVLSMGDRFLEALIARVRPLAN